MNSQQNWPFTIHENQLFKKLILKLKDSGVIYLKKNNSAQQVEISKIDVFHEIFSVVFLQYSTPDITNILLCKETNQILLRGKYSGYTIERISDEALEVLKILITKEDDADYENAFNALLCVCLASIRPCEFIFPNTYVVDLGRDTHEFDVIAGTNEKKCIIIESTRGFDKKVDKIDESYTWHFKKALFRKWMLEKIYNIECKLIYISLKKFLYEASSKLSLPKEPEEEANSLDESDNNGLISKLLKVEDQSISIIEFSEEILQSLNKENIINSVYNKIYSVLNQT